MAEDMGGGNGIETHGFHHMDCPLDENSGHFILAKWHGEDELHLTGILISLLFRLVSGELYSLLLFVCLCIGVFVYILNCLCVYSFMLLFVHEIKKNSLAK